MAIDTAAKRFSIMDGDLPSQPGMFPPDGVINQGDRQALMWLYSGILAGGSSAFDTAEKRFSIMGLDLPFQPGMIIPDGTIGAGDREDLLWLYSGISLSGGSSPSSDAVKRFSMMGLDLPYQPGIVLPDGTIDSGDRESFLWLYSGIPLSGSSGPSSDAVKRFSMMGLDLPYQPGTILPDGVIDAGDRESLLWLYSGIPLSGQSSGGDFNTPEKRFSIMGLDLPYQPGMIIPDGSIDAIDRADFLWLYSGLIGPPPPPPQTFSLTFAVISAIDIYGQGTYGEMTTNGKGVLGYIN